LPRAQCAAVRIVLSEIMDPQQGYDIWPVFVSRKRKQKNRNIEKEELFLILLQHENI
jgi:hypothetical protein